MIPMSFSSVTITGAGGQGLGGDCFHTPPTFLKDGVKIGDVAWTAEARSIVERRGTVVEIERVLTLASP